MIRSVAIIGAGIGAQHAAGLAQLPESFRIATICDLDEPRGRTLAELHGAEFTRDLSSVLTDPDVDIVDICLPPHLHFGACFDALDAGKVAICEKPLVTSLREADQLIGRAAESGGKVFPVFQYRYGQGTSELKALIAAGLAGRCYAGSIETHWDRGDDYYSVDWRGTWAGERGGALLGHAIHAHDLLMSLLGPVETVYADLATRVNEIEVEDCAALSIRMRDGARITSSVTLGASGNTSRLRLMFEGFTVESDHSAYAPAATSWQFKARSPVTQRQIDHVLSAVPVARSGYTGMFDAISAALDGTGADAVTLEDGRRSLEFVTAAYASSRIGQPQTLPIGQDHELYESWLP